MRILAMDPGAKRCGWAVLSEGSKNRSEIKYHDSGILGLVQPSKYQDYRLRLIEYWVIHATQLFHIHEPEAVVSEIVPPTGGTMGGIINRQLSLTVITTVQALAWQQHCPLIQIGASTVKKKVGGSGKASKVKVRDGVISLLPELESRRKEWTGKDAVYDEIDALAIGLTHLTT